MNQYDPEIEDPLERLDFNQFRIHLSKKFKSQENRLTKEQHAELVHRTQERLVQYADAGGEPRQWETVLIWQ